MPEEEKKTGKTTSEIETGSDQVVVRRATAELFREPFF